MRRARRARNTPYRKCKSNRVIGGIPPSTKARWDAHLRIMKQLLKILPISIVSVEGIQTRTKQGQKKWNKSFSPIEVGKKYFYNYVEKVLKLKLYLFQGYDTYSHRKLYGYEKTSDKLSEKFEAHCVDSFSLCEMVDGGQLKLSSTKIYHLTFLEFHRRQLHVLVPAKNGIRKTYGGTRSLGLTRGTLVKHHKKYGLSYVGGSMNDRISLHNTNTKQRLCQNAKAEDCKILTNQSYIINLK